MDEQLSAAAKRRREVELPEIAPPPKAQDEPGNRKPSWQEGEYTVYRGAARTAPGCHDNCGVLMYVKDGKLAKIEGDPENPYNQGRLCPRCLAIKEMIYHEDRLKYPMKRAKADRGKNTFERISWDEAYDIIEREMGAIIEKYGNEAIYVMQGTGRDINGYTPLTARYFGTPNSGTGFLSGNSCYAPRLFGTSLKVGNLFVCDYSQYFADRYDNPEWERPEYILIWGNNPVVANSDGTLGHWVVECMKRGSKLITIDPKLTWLAGKSEVWLQVRPGTDAALALAMCHQIIEDGLEDAEFCELWTYGFDEFKEHVKSYTPAYAAEICGVAEEDIIKAARLVGKAKNACLQWGVALDHSAEGFFAGIACFDLMALTGNFEKPGTMVVARPAFNVTPTWMASGGEWDYVAEPIPHPEKKICGGYKALEAMHAISPDSILESMETEEPYKVRACWMQTNNPITCMGAAPQRILAALLDNDFNVVVDLFMTPTALAAADILLPASAFCERAGVAGHQPYILQAIVKATDNYYEAKSDQQIIYEVGERFRGKGLSLWDTEEEFCDFVLRPSGFTYDELKERCWAMPEFTYNKHEKGLLRKDGGVGFNTSTGRYNFYSPELNFMGYPAFADYEEPPESPVSTPELAEEYPLILVSGARRWGFFHSEHRQSPSMRRLHPDPTVDIHPDTAKKYGLEQGDWCLIENQYGKAKMKVCTETPMREDMISTDHAWWLPERDPDDGTLFGLWEHNINQLIPMRPGKTGLGAEYKSQLCKISKVEED